MNNIDGITENRKIEQQLLLQKLAVLAMKFFNGLELI
jgi:hypothetical protein